MSERPSNTQSSDARTIDATLVALGFVHDDNDGTLVTPTDSVVTLAPIGAFFELWILLADGNIATAVLAKAALKISRVGAMGRRDG